MEQWKKQCIRVRRPPLSLVPELIEAIAKFLPTSADMFILLQAIPKKFLTQALFVLRHLMRTQASNYVKYSEAWCCPVAISRSLWPSLSITSKKEFEEGIAAIKDCFQLFSSAILRGRHCRIELPSRAGTNIVIHDIESYSNLTHIFKMKNVSVLTLDLNQITHWINDASKLKQLWEDLISFPYLQSLKIISKNGRSTTHVIDIVKILKLSSSLHHLHINATVCISATSPSPWTPNFIKHLAILSRNLNCLMLENMEVPGQHFVPKFQGCTKWLIKQNPEVLKFEHGRLSGITLKTKKISRLCKNICGTNLIECELSCYKSNHDAIEPMIKALESFLPMYNLRKLSISGFILSSKCCELLASILPRLEEFTLDGNKLDDECSLILVKSLSKCTRLQHLQLIGQHLTSTTAIVIANYISKCPSIRNLDLSYNRVGDRGAIAISQVLPRLDSINLTQNHIGYEGAIAMSKVIPQTSHVSITLDSNPLTKAGISAIISAIKSCSYRLRSVKMRNILLVNDQTLEHTFGCIPTKRWCAVQTKSYSLNYNDSEIYESESEETLDVNHF